MCFAALPPGRGDEKERKGCDWPEMEEYQPMATSLIDTEP